jgi:hypothetical protein
MQLFGDFDILAFVRMSRLKWIGHVNRMHSKRAVSQVFNNIPQESRLRGQPKNIWWNCVQADIKNSLLFLYEHATTQPLNWDRQQCYFIQNPEVFLRYHVLENKHFYENNILLLQFYGSDYH